MRYKYADAFISFFTHWGNGKYSGNLPAGVLYMPSKDISKFNGRNSRGVRYNWNQNET